MKALVMLLLGYTAYRMAIRIREENSSRLLLTDQRPDAPRAESSTRAPRTSAAASSTTSQASASRQRKRR
ncbi:MAG: hypothetical protein ACTHJV_02175 [Rhizobiaceae bacterium]